LPAQGVDLAAWHEAIYYATFVICLAWAFLRGAARSAAVLLWLAAAMTALIPLSSLVGVWQLGGSWNHGASGIAVDLTALGTVFVLLLAARHSRRRLREGHTDSIWADPMHPAALA
jgi:hypothetical protein